MLINQHAQLVAYPDSFKHKMKIYGRLSSRNHVLG